jgi:ferritin-like metal-binding protein YciE
MPITSAEDLLLRKLHGIDDAEQQASRAMQAQIANQTGELRSLIERRLKEGERLRREVGKAVERLDGRAKPQTNRAARGLIEESEALLSEVEDEALQEAVLIDGLQSLEHYCIAAWGTVKAIARELGEDELVTVMQSALEEGHAWDREMTELAEAEANPMAAGEGEDDAEEDDEEDGETARQGQSAAQKGSRGGEAAGKGGATGKAAKGGATAKAAKGAQGSDLQGREYKDERGQVHHHTHEYMERSKKR